MPELAREDVREVLLRNLRVVYRLIERRVGILTVLEGHRLFPEEVARED